MSGTSGIRNVTARSFRLKAGATPTGTTPVLKIWTVTAIGPPRQVTEMFGRLMQVPILFLIRMAAGFGNLTMAGPGFPTSLGAGRPITMAVGFIMATPGPGGPARLARLTTLSGLPHTFRFLVLADATLGLE